MKNYDSSSEVCAIISDLMRAIKYRSTSQVSACDFTDSVGHIESISLKSKLFLGDALVIEPNLFMVQDRATTGSPFFFPSKALSEHKQNVVLGQVPMFKTDVQRIRRFTEIGLLAPLSLNGEWRSANDQVENIVSRTPNARFLDFSNSSFFSAAPYDQGVLIYRDTHHLNEQEARRYGRYAADELQRAFALPQSTVNLKQ
ncbi:hypothetical protein [Pseudomonas sp. BNK-15]|uniref:hypothetical protein n=1 Tax=Pseudomonas sp. BNK-15 TaxID=3376152 RepID=UPI0039BFB00C